MILSYHYYLSQGSSLLETNGAKSDKNIYLKLKVVWPGWLSDEIASSIKAFKKYTSINNWADGRKATF